MKKKKKKKTIKFLLMSIIVLLNFNLKAMREDTSLRSYVNIENVDRTVPAINKFLSELTVELDNERQLKESVTWLKSPAGADVLVRANVA